MDFSRSFKSLNSTFIVLMPKKEEAKSFTDFRPISLVSNLYKLIYNVLSKKISNMLHLIISENQHAFVRGKQITDVFMITNEMADELLVGKKEGVLCKLDIEKAIDHVNWKFVDYMLGRLGFGKKWRK